MLKHDDPIDSRDWELRIGKGGQIYSYKAFSKEAIPPQWRSSDHGPVGHESEYAPWIDEVFQTVAVSTPLNKLWKPLGYDYFMHGSGVYLRDNPRLERPFYNPTLIDGPGPEPNSYVTVNWMNQAHVPTFHPSHALSYAKYRDVGNGIIEVTAGVYNFSDNVLDFFNFPWGGVRSSSFGGYVLEDNGNELSLTSGKFPSLHYTFDELSGWVMFTDGRSREGHAIGLVFGKDKTPLPSRYQTGRSVWRGGFAGGHLRAAQAKRADNQWRNYQVSSVVRRFEVPVGSGVWVRYYFVTGSRADVQSQIMAHDLVDKADYGLLEIDIETADAIAWYGNKGEHLSTDPSSGARQYEFFAQPVKGTVPVFQLEAPSGTWLVTSDPMALTDPYPDGMTEKNILRPYDGKTVTWQLMGFAMPDDAPGVTPK